VAWFLTDEHVPGPFVNALRSLGHDVVRAKDELEEGAEDERLLAFARSTGRIVVTCDRRFTVVDDAAVDEHGGVIYAEQTVLQTRPEDAAAGIDLIASTIGSDEMDGLEFYLGAWL